MVVASMIIVPVLVVRMQADYFLAERDAEQSMGVRHPAWRVTGVALKNFAGALLVIGGLLMCVLPGQGLLTILIGLAVMDFPGKRKLELWLIRRKPVHWAIDKMRQKAARPPLVLP